MREAIFKGKRIDNGEWVYGAYVSHDWHPVDVESEEFDGVVVEESNIISYEDDCLWYRVIPESVSEFTGLTDKNGKKIFEGDIVKCKHRWIKQTVFGEVSFNDDEEEFFGQKIRGAYGKCVEPTPLQLFGNEYYYFRNYVVEYYAPSGGWRLRNGSCFHGLTRNYILGRDTEIIGNIHDNPELLKNDKE